MLHTELVNDNSLESVEKIELGILKWGGAALVILAILGGIFWTLFYSSYFANLPFVIPLRNFYQNTFWQFEGIFIKSNAIYPPFNPVYTIQVQRPLQSGANTYTLIGTFSSLDAKNGIIYIKGIDNNVYPFYLDTFFFKDPMNTWIKMANISNIDQLSTYSLPAKGGPIDTAHTFLNYDQITVTNNIPSSKINTIAVRWNDRRILSQMESDYQKDTSTPLNDEFNDSIILAEFK